jgi:hypothetical protein
MTGISHSDIFALGSLGSQPLIGQYGSSGGLLDVALDNVMASACIAVLGFAGEAACTPDFLHS